MNYKHGKQVAYHMPNLGLADAQMIKRKTPPAPVQSPAGDASSAIQSRRPQQSQGLRLRSLTRSVLIS